MMRCSPLLLLIILSIFQFGRAWTGAARLVVSGKNRLYPVLERRQPPSLLHCPSSKLQAIVTTDKDDELEETLASNIVSTEKEVSAKSKDDDDSLLASPAIPTTLGLVLVVVLVIIGQVAGLNGDQRLLAGVLLHWIFWGYSTRLIGLAWDTICIASVLHNALTNMPQ